MEPDLATVSMDDSLDDCEADACSFDRLVIMETLEYTKKFVTIPHIKAYAVVPHEKNDS